MSTPVPDLVDADGAPRHPVADLLLRAWLGPREPVDGSWRRAPTWRDGVHAVVSVTGRAVSSM